MTNFKKKSGPIFKKKLKNYIKFMKGKPGKSMSNICLRAVFFEEGKGDLVD